MTWFGQPSHVAPDAVFFIPCTRNVARLPSFGFTGTSRVSSCFLLEIAWSLLASFSAVCPGSNRGKVSTILRLASRTAMPGIGALEYCWLNQYAWGRRMIRQMNFSLASTTLALPNTGESEPLSNRVDGHHVSAPEIPTSRSFDCFLAAAKAASS